MIYMTKLPRVCLLHSLLIYSLTLSEILFKISMNNVNLRFEGFSLLLGERMYKKYNKRKKKLTRKKTVRSMRQVTDLILIYFWGRQ